MVSNLKDNLYTLSDEDANMLISEPEKVFPKLAAQLHANVLEAAVQGIVAQMGSVVENILQTRETQQKSTDTFFTRWPKLQDHSEQVQRVAAIYRQMNPQATPETAMEEIGLQAMMLLHIPLEETVVADVPVAQNPPMPPAGPGISTASSAPAATESNAFTNLAEEFLQEDSQ